VRAGRRFAPRARRVQRLAAVVLVEERPRSVIGKVMKGELREGFAGAVG